MQFETALVARLLPIAILLLAIVVTLFVIVMLLLAVNDFKASPGSWVFLCGVAAALLIFAAVLKGARRTVLN
jgi:hypothetical protein